MSAPEAFHSPLAPAMADFVAFKRMQGYDYTEKVKALSHFDRFLLGVDCADGLLREAHFEAYLAATAALSPSTREGRFSVARQFSRHLHAHRPESAVPPANMLPRHARHIRFRRLEPEHVRDLMEAAIRLRPENGPRPWSVCFLIGMLYTTGLRLAEAINLDLGDIDPERGTVLVRRGKFGKDRLVPLSPSAWEALECWLRRRSRWASTGPSAPLLIGGDNARLACDQARYAFRVLRRRCGMQDNPPPRLHDLRHNFACRCIARWREEDRDVNALLPVLANAMGHVDIHATQVYIHVEAAALQQASVTFFQYTQHQEEQS